MQKPSRQCRSLKGPAAIWMGVVAFGFLLGCQGPAPEPTAIRLVDLFADATVVDAVEAAPVEPAILRFDGTSTIPDSKEPAETLGWEAFHQVESLTIRDGRLVGKAAGEQPMLILGKTEGLGRGDLLHAVEIRIRSSAGSDLAMFPIPRKPPRAEFFLRRPMPPTLKTPLEAGDEFKTYTMTNVSPFFTALSFDRMGFLVLQLTGAAGAEFEIESLRFISRKEHLASVASGIGWHGLGNVYRETLVARAPEAVLFEVDLVSRPWMELTLGTIDDGAVRFHVGVRSGSDSSETTVLEKTLTTPRRWEPVSADLSSFAGQRVTLALSLEAEKPGQVGFWGAPAIRHLGPGGRPAEPSPARTALIRDGAPPQGVIVLLVDTLRRDRLSFYGNVRETSPVLARLAAEGAVFENPIAQAAWTKVSVPSILSSLYASTHGIAGYTDRLPAAAVTMAEAFRDAGYATFGTSSVPFTGRLSNLHQGFEVFHEAASTGDLGHSNSKTARVFVDRLLPWLDDHREVPFFVLLHVLDPHDPFEPYPPYGLLYSTPEENAAHGERAAKIKPVLAKEVNIHLPSRAHLEEAGVDPAAYVEHELSWYDASIRAMDAEVGRLVEALRNLGLEEQVVLAMVSDHGEEFLEHGNSFHGSNTYGEMINVPLTLWWPGRVPAIRVPNVVETIDLMPTLLDLAALPVSESLQGQSLLPLLAGDLATLGWRPRPAFSERAMIPEETFYLPDIDSFAVVADGWKLVQNTRRPEGHPEFELYDVPNDPLDQKDVAGEHPDVVERLAKQIAAWQEGAQAARLPADEAATEGLSPEELEKLRALGYIN